MTEDLFTLVAKPESPCVLRPYQVQAADDVESKWQTHNSVLGCMATGGGKTQVACELIRRRGCRTFVVCHRNELVEQARNRLAQFGIRADIEKADRCASVKLWNRNQVVIGTPQTLYSRDGARLKRFDPAEFEMLWVDEVHHFVSPKFQTIINHFKQNQNLKFFGCSATPDRHDGKALARIIDAVAFNIHIQYLIQEGWLVNVDQRLVKIDGLDFSNCRVTAGDFNQRDLADVLEEEKPLLGIADSTLQTVGDKRTLVFAVTVKQAERYAEIFNRYKPNCAATVFGNTPEDTRRDTFKRFHNGEIQFLVNVGVVTEGVDVPGIEAIVVARPTLSRSLYTQMLGRGTRPLSGLVDQYPTAEERRSAIAASPKPNVLVLDFKGNALRHKLTISSVDVLGGNFSEEAKAKAREKVEKAGRGDILAELIDAETEVRKGIKAKASFRATYVDPFEAYHKHAQKWEGFQQGPRLSRKQRDRLIKNGWNPDDHTIMENLTRHKELISATLPQRNFLKYCKAPKEVYDDPNLVKWEASRLIDGCVKNGKRWPEGNDQTATQPPDTQSDSHTCNVDPDIGQNFSGVNNKIPQSETNGDLI